MYNMTSQPAIASEINLADSIELPSEVEETKEFTVQLTIDSFGLTPQRIGSDVDLNSIKVRGKTNSTAFSDLESIPIRNDISLSNNQTVDNVLDSEPSVIPLTVEFNENSIQLIIEFLIETNTSYNIRETISIREDFDKWSEPNGSEPTDLETIYNNLDGIGTSSDPYIIMDDYDLQCINYNDESLSSHYALGQNIDASETEKWNDGGFNSIGYEFEGVLNGRGHIIDGLYINKENTDYIGLFERINNGKIKELGVTNVNIKGNLGVGSLVGINNEGNIKNCYANGFVSGYNNVGGLSGFNRNGLISNSYANVDVEIRGGWRAAGLVGYNRSNGIIENCYSTGEISGYNDSSKLGGLVGQNNDSSVSSSYWDTKASGLSTSSGGKGLKTNEMQGENYDDGFETDIINNDSFKGQIDDYPILKWQKE